MFRPFGSSRMPVERRGAEEPEPPEGSAEKERFDLKGFVSRHKRILVLMALLGLRVIGGADKLKGQQVKWPTIPKAPIGGPVKAGASRAEGISISVDKNKLPEGDAQAEPDTAAAAQKEVLILKPESVAAPEAAAAKRGVEGATQALNKQREKLEKDAAQKGEKAELPIEVIYGARDLENSVADALAKAQEAEDKAAEQLLAAALASLQGKKGAKEALDAAQKRYDETSKLVSELILTAQLARGVAFKIGNDAIILMDQHNMETRVMLAGKNIAGTAAKAKGK